ncbi:hypothetical protein K08M3_18900 [Vibrio alginolyticus]|uniref:Lipoprotein n=1 Tax=Vibrio alginolyticus TaxID=663 RepID=A0A1W6TSD7_VIBAL|nr:hypothetical protein [Vibrio alginolyticus]ARO98827.1 hypothetical protein K01M1_18860 [Vibrio alginolyticus]ARP03543.1 hypothetical protein K04M1_18990 [Vibrio alginolyticus]ARP08603.1 hypothetical protein K04M3_19020 [Vibrio alginolyticus]ARP13678.1 hypothetical protein K04M5_18900 [Vibrio alginolyticus]ARP18738.1 hypothetical protein K05K4_19040 [Vibrio alginolyticus]
MKFIKYIIFIVFVTAALSGCAVKNDKTELQGVGLTYKSEVRALENGTLYVEVEAAPGAGRERGSINSALSIAGDYCLSFGKGVKQLSIETDSHLLVNSVAKLTFECV